MAAKKKRPKRKAKKKPPVFTATINRKTGAIRCR
jgi:hypothetical protein